MKPTGFCLEAIYGEHDTGEHPENRGRLDEIATLLDGMMPHFDLRRIEAFEAPLAEIARVHTERLITRIAATAGGGRTHLDPDTVTSAASFSAARFAVGGVLALLDELFAGRIANGFAFVRPPGHHAESDRAMGFCLFNNVAIGARYALERYGVERIAIIDWDVHHGNGTQAAFFEDPRVLFVSLHQYPLYPGSGRLEEIGKGEGRGCTVNVPIPSGCGDAEYLTLFDEVVLPLLHETAPGLILVSAGFDAHAQDPLAQMRVSAEGFGQMAARVLDVAEASCGGRVLMVLEGGYSREGLRASVRAVLEEMLMPKKPLSLEKPAPRAEPLLAALQGIL
ncbi:MAG: histone deacetylase, partial [Deltaproteobacteria bacterium]